MATVKDLGRPGNVPDPHIISKRDGTDAEFVVASSSSQVLGSDGQKGDFLAGILVIPATTSPGAVSVQDGDGTDRTIFTGGASSVSNLVPFFVVIGARSINGPWKVTTGANVAAQAIGSFTGHS